MKKCHYQHPFQSCFQRVLVKELGNKNQSQCRCKKVFCIKTSSNIKVCYLPNVNVGQDKTKIF